MMMEANAKTTMELENDEEVKDEEQKQIKLNRSNEQVANHAVELGKFYNKNGLGALIQL